MANSTPSAPLQAAVEDLVRILQQPSPPSLRELLEAYSVKGNGDRELLLAMLSAKSSEDQRVAAVIQSHQTLIQAHAAAQTQMQQQQLLVQYQQQGRAVAGPGPSQETARGTQQQQTETETPRQMQRQMHLQAPGHQVTGSGNGGPGAGVIAPPSPSGTSQSQSSSSSPRLVTTLPPLHSHLGDVRTMGGGPQTKRRRTERDVMMLESIGSRGASLGGTCRLDSGRERRERLSSSSQSQPSPPSSSSHTQGRGGGVRERSRDVEQRTATRMAVDTDGGTER